VLDGKLNVATAASDLEISSSPNIIQPFAPDQVPPITQTPIMPGTVSVAPISTANTPQIAINIQLHLPETENAEVYEKLFKALKEHLLPRT
jgi:hypothetical protein